MQKVELDKKGKTLGGGQGNNKHLFLALRVLLCFWATPSYGTFACNLQQVKDSNCSTDNQANPSNKMTKVFVETNIERKYINEDQLFICRSG